jgi:hypothetical protein
MIVMLVLFYRRQKINENAANYLERKVWPLPLNAMQVGDMLQRKTTLLW